MSKDKWPGIVLSGSLPNTPISALRLAFYSASWSGSTSISTIALHTQKIPTTAI